MNRTSNKTNKISSVKDDELKKQDLFLQQMVQMADPEDVKKLLNVIQNVKPSKTTIQRGGANQLLVNIICLYIMTAGGAISPAVTISTIMTYSNTYGSNIFGNVINTLQYIA